MKHFLSVEREWKSDRRAVLKAVNSILNAPEGYHFTVKFEKL